LEVCEQKLRLLGKLRVNRTTRSNNYILREHWSSGRVPSALDEMNADLLRFTDAVCAHGVGFDAAFTYF